MAIQFKTGRSRTVTAHWDLNGTVQIEYGVIVGSYIPPLSLKLAYFELDFFGFHLEAMGGYQPSDMSSMGGYIEAEDEKTAPAAYVAISNDWDLTTVSAASPDTTWGPIPEGVDSKTFSGGYAEIVAPVEEWCVVDGLDPLADPATTIYQVPWPTFGGSGIADGIYGRKVWYQERPATGNTTTAHIDFCGASVDYSLTLPTDAVLTYAMYSLVNSVAQNGTATFAAPKKFNGVSIDHAYTASDAKHTANGLACSISVTEDSGTLGAFASGEIRSSCSPKIKYTLSGRLRAQDSAYPDSLTAHWQCKDGGDDLTLSPTGSLSREQEDYEIYAIFDGTPQTGVALHEQTPTYVYLKSSSLSANGEDTRDWRIQIQGTKWDAVSLSWAAKEFAGTGLSGDRTYTLSLSGDDRAWHGARYLMVRARLDTSGYTGTGDPPDSLPMTVSVEGLSKSFAVTTTAATSTLDLATAGDVSTQVNTIKETRTPLASGVYGFPTLEPADRSYYGWGVDWCESLSFSIPDTDGIKLVVESARLDSTTRRRATFLSPFALLEGGWTSDTDTTTLQRHALLEVDGRVCDWPANALVEPTTGADPYWREYSITEIVSMLGLGPNWTATALTGPDSYHTADLPAYLLGGGTGATVDPVSGVAVDWYDRATGTIPAQDAWDMVQVYPGAGEVWTAGSYDVPTLLHFSKSLRAQGTGILYDGSGVAETGATAELRRVSDNALRGTGTTDTLGYYATGTPWAVGSALHRLQRPGGAGPEFAIANRMRHRAALAPSGAKNPHLLDVPDGRVYLAYGAGATLRAREYWHGGYGDYRHDSLIDANGFRPRLCWDFRDRLLLVAYEREGTMLLRTSKDGGRTWTTEVDMGTGYRPEPAASHLGPLCRFHIESAGGSDYRVMSSYRTDAPGLVFSTPVAVTDESGNPILCPLEGWGGCVAPWHREGGWLLSVVPSGETAPVMYRSRERKALTFKRL